MSSASVGIVIVGMFGLLCFFVVKKYGHKFRK